MQKESWLKWTNPVYDERQPRWCYVDDVYTGHYVEPDRIGRYLPQKKQGESDEAYQWRRELVDPDLLFAALINGIAGHIFAAEKDIVRAFEPEDAPEAEGLGDPLVRGTKAYRIWHDADGKGTNYPVFWRRAVVDILRFQEMWFLVEGVKRSKAGEVVQEPCMQAIAPERVLDWREEEGRLVEVKVRHTAAKERASVEDKPGTEELYTVYGLDGWKRYRLKEDKGTASGEQVEEEVASGTYEWYGPGADGQKGRRGLPIYRTILPLEQNVAYLLAKKAVAAFNLESGRDALLHTGNTPRLVDESLNSDKHAEQIEEGGNYHETAPGEKMYFIAPDTAPATLATEVLREKWKNLFISGYRQYADEAAQKTATEVRQDREDGIGAFLGFLSVAAEEAERQALFLFEQAEFPERPALWGLATVERSEDFSVGDEKLEADRMAERVFGKDAPVPIGNTGRKSAALRYAEAHALEAVDDEIEAEVGLGVERVRVGVEADRRALEERDPIARRRAEIENGTGGDGE